MKNKVGKMRVPNRHQILPSQIKCTDQTLKNPMEIAWLENIRTIYYISF